MALSGPQKVAVFLSLLGVEDSAKILKYLPLDLVSKVSPILARMPKPDPESADLVLNEFKRLNSLPEAPPAAPGSKIPEKEIIPSEKETALKTEEKASLNAKRLSRVLLVEQPQVIAFVLSLLPAKVASDVLLLLADRKRSIKVMMEELKSTTVTEKIKKKVLDLISSIPEG